MASYSRSDPPGSLSCAMQAVAPQVGGRLETYEESRGGSASGRQGARYAAGAAVAASVALPSAWGNSSGYDRPAAACDLIVNRPFNCGFVSTSFFDVIAGVTSSHSCAVRFSLPAPAAACPTTARLAR